MKISIKISDLHVHVHRGLFIGSQHSKPCCCLATKADLEQLNNTIMTTIAEFAANMATYQEKLNVAVRDLTGDISSLAQKIADLQASQGQLTPEDQALLDGIEASASEIVAKVEALAAVTPPPAPVEE